jgi:ABC-2 type transport system ATP-binding protein
VVAVEDGADGVKQALEGIDGVDEAKAIDRDGSYRLWRVTSPTNAELCPMIFDALRDKGWRVAELRSDARTLESVFRELADNPDTAAAGKPPARRDAEEATA